MRPIKIDRNHCEVEVIDTDATPMFGYYPYKKKKVKCNWEFNPMIGMGECNSCGMTR
jgi:hypothetical protein